MINIKSNTNEQIIYLTNLNTEIHRFLHLKELYTSQKDTLDAYKPFIINSFYIDTDEGRLILTDNIEKG